MFSVRTAGKKIHLFISEYLLLCCLYNRCTIFGYFISCATMGELTVQNEGPNKLLSSLLQEQASAREHKETLFSSIEHLMEPVYFKQTSLKFLRFTYLSSIYGCQLSSIPSLKVWYFWSITGAEKLLAKLAYSLKPIAYVCWLALLHPFIQKKPDEAKLHILAAYQSPYGQRFKLKHNSISSNSEASSSFSVKHLMVQ